MRMVRVREKVFRHSSGFRFNVSFVDCTSVLVKSVLETSLPPEPEAPCLSKYLVIKSHYDDVIMVHFSPYFSCTCTHGRMWVYGREVATPLTFDNRELKQRRRWRQRERQKSNWFRLAKQQLCTCITLFCTFLCRHCTTTTWKCLMSRFVEDLKTKQGLSLSFPDLRYRVLESNSRNRCRNIWRNKRDEIRAIKFN